MLKIQTDKYTLEGFAKNLTIILFLLSSFWSYKDCPNAAQILLYAAFFFSFISLFIPTSIKYLYIGWMNVANTISSIMTRLILFLVYFAFITPYSFLVKLFKGDILGKKLEPQKTTYWKDKEKHPINLERYRRQF